MLMVFVPKRASLREGKTKRLRRRKEGQEGSGDLVSCKIELNCFIVPRYAWKSLYFL